MNYKDFNLGDWIGHISGVIEDETTLDGNEMRDLVKFLSTLKKEPVLDKIRAEIETERNAGCHTQYAGGLDFALSIIDKYKAEANVYTRHGKGM